MRRGAQLVRLVPKVVLLVGRGPVAADGDESSACELTSCGTVLVEPERTGVMNVPPVEQLAEGEQHESLVLAVQDRAGDDVADLFA